MSLLFAKTEACTNIYLNDRGKIKSQYHQNSLQVISILSNQGAQAIEEIQSLITIELFRIVPYRMSFLRDTQSFLFNYDLLLLKKGASKPLRKIEAIFDKNWAFILFS